MRSLLSVMALLAALGVAGCGESKQDKAQTQVCDARADISKQVDELKGLSIATATPDGIRANVDAIQDDLRQMVNAQKTLSDDRRKQVSAATDQFRSSVTQIAQGLTSDVSLSEAATRLRAAAQDLGAAYTQSLGKIDCAGA
jgi:hypothetical protein